MGSIVSMNASATQSGIVWNVSVTADITWTSPEVLNSAQPPRAQPKNSSNADMGAPFTLTFNSVVSTSPLVHRYTGGTSMSSKPDHVDATANFSTTTYSQDTASASV